jgi:hypothetical protein
MIKVKLDKDVEFLFNLFKAKELTVEGIIVDGVDGYWLFIREVKEVVE